MIGRQSTIDRPDSVRRVTPPNKIIPRIVAAHTASQSAIQRALSCASTVTAVILLSPRPVILPKSAQRLFSALHCPRIGECSCPTSASIRSNSASGPTSCWTRFTLDRGERLACWVETARENQRSQPHAHSVGRAGAGGWRTLGRSQYHGCPAGPGAAEGSGDNSIRLRRDGSWPKPVPCCPDTTLISDSSGQNLGELSQIQSELEHLGGWSMAQRIEKILQQLDLNADERLATLSGGWRRRAARWRARWS